MFALPTLNEYLDNPMGKGSTAIPNKQLIKDDLIRRYKELKKKKKKFQLQVYKNEWDYYFHIIVPSESERDNNYDVVLYFTIEDEEDLKHDNFLFRYYLRFFSNCPSFTYTFAYVFNQTGFLIPSLTNKFDSEVLNNQPVVRNPGEVISFEKSLYFACLFIKDSLNLRAKHHLNQIAKPFTPGDLNDAIRSTATIDLEIKKANRELAKKKDELAKLEKKKKEGVINNLLNRGKERLSGKSSIKMITPKKKITARKNHVVKKIGQR